MWWTWVYEIPTWQLGLILAAFFAIVTAAGTIAFRPIVKKYIHGAGKANDLVGILISCYSVFYGLLLGLIAVAAFGSYTTSDDNVNKEAGLLGSLYQMAAQFPEPTASTLKTEVRTYLKYEIETHWPRQKKGVTAWAGADLIAPMYHTVAAFDAQDRKQEVLQAETLKTVKEYAALRQSRLGAATSGIPPTLYWVVVLGALLNLILIWMFDMELQIHLVLGVVFSVFISLVVLMIIAMDWPFRGEVSVGPDHLKNVYESVMQADDRK
jgi:hypothetical protein